MGPIAWRNLPLRHGKHEFYEGGLRVPFLVLGPGIEAISLCRARVTGLDLLPTFAELAGRTEAFPVTIDGDSLVPILRNGGKGDIARRREALIFHQGANRTPSVRFAKGSTSSSSTGWPAETATIAEKSCSNSMTSARTWGKQRTCPNRCPS